MKEVETASKWKIRRVKELPKIQRSGMRQLSITVTENQYKWLQEQVKSGKMATISHAIRYAIQTLREKETQ